MTPYLQFSDQAIGALMMALQKSIFEQSDIVPMLRELDLVTDSEGKLTVVNPPVVKADLEALAEKLQQETQEEENNA